MLFQEIVHKGVRFPFHCFQVEWHQHSKSCIPLKIYLPQCLMKQMSWMMNKNILKKAVPLPLQQGLRKISITCWNTREALALINLLLTQPNQSLIFRSLCSSVKASKNCKKFRKLNADLCLHCMYTCTEYVINNCKLKRLNENINMMW